MTELCVHTAQSVKDLSEHLPYCCPWAWSSRPGSLGQCYTDIPHTWGLCAMFVSHCILEQFHLTREAFDWVLGKTNKDVKLWRICLYVPGSYIYVLGLHCKLYQNHILVPGPHCKLYQDHIYMSQGYIVSCTRITHIYPRATLQVAPGTYISSRA
jgi:hypothetical protein